MILTSKHTDFRTLYNSLYRYSFQGQLHDDELKGEGNSVNYKYRMHDPRIGRFFAVDPLADKYPHNSPYAFSENRVIDGVELEGLEVQTLNGKTVAGPYSEAGAETAPDFETSDGGNDKNEEPYDGPSFSSTTTFEMEDSKQGLIQMETMKKMEHSPLGDFAKIGQGLTYGPEAVVNVFLPEIAGAKVASWLLKVSPMIKEYQIAERGMRVGLNYYNQSLSSGGDYGISSKNQISLTLAGFTPIKMGTGLEWANTIVNSQISFTYNKGFEGFWDRSTAVNGLSLVNSALGKGLNQTPLLSNKFANKLFVNSLTGTNGFIIKSINNGE